MIFQNSSPFCASDRRSYASPDGKALIREGAIQASAAQFPTRVGEQAADTLYRLLNGEKVESRILVPVELVTQENVEEYSIDRWQ